MQICCMQKEVSLEGFSELFCHNKFVFSEIYIQFIFSFQQIVSFELGKNYIFSCSDKTICILCHISAKYYRINCNSGEELYMLPGPGCSKHR